MKIKQHLGKDLVNVPEFAKRKEVSIVGAWAAVNAGRIPVVVVGETHVFINWPQNKNFSFKKIK